MRQIPTLDQLRRLMGRGASTPAPGIDCVEKWAVRALSNEAFAVFHRMAVWLLGQSRFPAFLQLLRMVLLYKKGSPVDLGNYRGIVIANCLLVTVEAWFTWCLQRYAWTQRLLPSGQIAANGNVQPRDLTSFYAQVQAAASVLGEKVYVLKRDQKQCYDRIHQTAFSDFARQFAGLPESVAVFSDALQTNVQCLIQTAHGLAEPFSMDGVTRQGGSSSPIRYALASGMGDHWIADCTEPVVIQTRHGRANQLHTPDDKLALKLSSTNAMDDSLLFSRTIQGLLDKARLLHHFERAYNAQTDWTQASKTAISILGPTTDIPNTITVELSEHERYDIPVLPPNFLRTDIGDCDKRFHLCENMIASFVFPMQSKRLPIAVLRRVLVSLLYSSLEAKLRLQPITSKQADQLDRQIASRVKEYYNLPFAFNSKLLCLPVAQHGFGFPSIRRINAVLAIDGMQRDLNTHIDLFRHMSRITFANWRCLFNACQNPFISASTAALSPKSIRGRLPFAWLIAAVEMRTCGLGLRQTDQSYLSTREISAEHALTRSLGNPSQLLRTAITALQTYHGRQLTLLDLTDLLHKGQLAHGLPNRAVPKVFQWLTSLKGIHLVEGDLTSLLTIDQRKQRFREDILDALPRTRTGNILVRRSAEPHVPLTYGSDGSMLPASASRWQERSVTAAVVGPVELRIQLNYPKATIQQGEIVGHVATAIIDDELRNGLHALPRKSLLLTDHLNSVKLIREFVDWRSLPFFLPNRTGRTFYKCLDNVLQDNTHLDVQYTAAHQENDSFETQLNNMADQAARLAHTRPHLRLAFPTFTLPDFSLYSESTGYVDEHCREIVEDLMVQQQLQELEFDHPHTYKRVAASALGYCALPPPDGPYLFSLAGYTALVQLQARSGQLPTRALWAGRFDSEEEVHDQKCAHCECEIETAHHVFIECAQFASLRQMAAQKLEVSTLQRLKKHLVQPELSSAQLVAYMATRLFADGGSWPEGKSAYYVGQLPDFQRFLPPNSSPKLTYGIARDWHQACIFLASRIWGARQKRVSKS